MRSRRSRFAAGVVLVAVIGALLVWWLRPEEEPDRAAETRQPAAPAPTPTVSSPPLDPVPGPCDRPPRKPFIPEELTVEGVVEGADVIGVPRDSRGVTGVLPFGNRSDFAWDLGGIRPGSKRGNVLLNTHTWPGGADVPAAAVGNGLLAGLDRGDEIRVSGDRGALLCYRVTDRIEILATLPFPDYYEDDGRPRLAIIVCSGERTGPSEWTHRTIWFARPVA
ncbi:class F sortase [Nocardioides stalactiti]|uniref:class F sortase n=1 Tax=Nocardioides stalactiti TaxID=2755356 RepID=UPI0015FECA66|nr:class F sortase [Nocardioides stalactiti]